LPEKNFKEYELKKSKQKTTALLLILGAFFEIKAQYKHHFCTNSPQICPKSTKNMTSKKTTK